MNGGASDRRDEAAPAGGARILILFQRPKETAMSKRRQRGFTILAVIASLVFATAALAADAHRVSLEEAAPFAEADEEL